MHLKLPWPADKIYRFRTEQIQSFAVGYTPDAQSEAATVVLWTKPHAHEENFLVGNRQSAADAKTATNDAAAKPVGLITVSIPVQFQITNLIDWVYQNTTPQDLLESLATREVVHYLAGSDLNEILSQGRLAAASTFRDRIQEAATAAAWARRSFSSVCRTSTPRRSSDVAATYEKVVGAEQTRLKKILDAESAAIRTNVLAGAQAFTVTNVADANRVRVVTAAYARAALFTNQIPAFAAAPSVYRERLFLQAFPGATRNARKYIMLATNTQDVAIFDLEEQGSRGFVQYYHHEFAMKKNALTLIVAAVLLVIFALLLFTFQVRQSEEVVVSTFLKPTDTITNAGLYVKWPWPIQSINRFDQRVQTFEDKFSETYLADNSILLASVYVGWRISDAKAFFPKFRGGSALDAQAKLETMLRSAKQESMGQT